MARDRGGSGAGCCQLCWPGGNRSGEWSNLSAEDDPGGHHNHPTDHNGCADDDGHSDDYDCGTDYDCKIDDHDGTSTHHNHPTHHN